MFVSEWLALASNIQYYWRLSSRNEGMGGEEEQERRVSQVSTTEFYQRGSGDGER
jgi:hypothetical protein